MNHTKPFIVNTAFFVKTTVLQHSMQKTLYVHKIKSILRNSFIPERVIKSEIYYIDESWSITRTDEKKLLTENLVEALGDQS